MTARHETERRKMEKNKKQMTVTENVTVICRKLINSKLVDEKTTGAVITYEDEISPLSMSKITDFQAYLFLGKERCR